ncbi:MAG: AAA family ATPase [Terriglobia bacterium]
MSESPRIVLAVGLPGCGKSTYLAGQKSQPISSDAIRLQLADDERDQRFQRRVFATVRYLLRQRIEIGRPRTFIDATNLTRCERRPYLDMGREFGCVVEALWFDVPLAVCKSRNGLRRRAVPEFAMDLMAAKFVPPSLAEGFLQIHRIG